MNIPRRSRSLLTIALVISVVASASTIGAVENQEGAAPESVVRGEYLVQLDERPQGLQLAGLGMRSLGFGIYVIVDGSVGVDSSDADPYNRAAQLSELLGAEVVPNKVSPLLFDNPEPNATNQWSLDNFAQFVGGVADADIDGEEAWDAATGAGVVVAVIDSGADLDHPDLAANLWVNTAETPGNGIDDDANGYIDDVNGWDFLNNDPTPEDTSGIGHGTAVAGIIAAPINGVGLAGVAPDASIMVLLACTDECIHGDVIAALAYAANNGADVVNLSFGGSGTDPLLEAAVQSAIDAGIVVVAAAGNDGSNNDIFPIYPAGFGMAGLLAVAMTNHGDDLDFESNYGATTVHLGAPGVSIWSLDLGAGYNFWSGTSFAAPTTAGIAALITEHRSCYSPSRIANVISGSGDPIPALSGVTISGKRANAFEALAVNASKTEIRVAPAPAAVSFSGGNGATVWTFGDGDSTVGASARHVYDLGTYTADDGTSTYEIAAGYDFVDTCTNLFIDEIMWLSASGITLGCGEGPTFCPSNNVYRAHMASFLARALDLPPASGDYFTDDESSLHEENINRLFEAGITFGCGGTNFCPEAIVSRGQMASFLGRAFNLPAATDDYFTDDTGTTHEANINALAESGITSGCGGVFYCPFVGVERDQMAAFLFRGREYLP